MLILGTLLLAVPVRATDWPEFRGPGAQGHSEATRVPIHWSSTSNIAWKTEVERGWSSPVISGDRIYLTSARNEGGAVSLRVIAIKKANGKISWDKEALSGSENDAKQVHSKNGLASPTPIVRDGKIYAHFGHMGTAALDLNGNVLWRQTSIKYPPVHGNGGSPLLIEDLLVFGCDGADNPFLSALDAKNGAVRWKTARNTTARNKFSFSTPLDLTMDRVKTIVSPASGFVGGYSTDGKELWRVRYGEGYSVVPRPVFGNGLLYVTSGFDRPVVFAIDPAGAHGDVTSGAVRWQQAKGAPNTPSLLLAGKELFMVSDGGIASCLDGATGEIIWSERLGGNFSASPFLAETRIYFVNESGVTLVLDAARQYKLIARNDLGEQTLSSPAPDDGALYVRTDTHLWRIGKAN